MNQVLGAFGLLDFIILGPVSRLARIFNLMKLLFP
jgi:hypothetical protein